RRNGLVAVRPEIPFTASQQIGDGPTVPGVRDTTRHPPLHCLRVDAQARRDVGVPKPRVVEGTP
ncbi:MAG: hypothetical protein AB7V44_09815, partial [Pseudonocardia sp.]